jgi:probable F420-dependent oxidoreductase
MKVDATIRGRIGTIGDRAARLERIGLDAVWVGETNHEPFLQASSAANSTSRLSVGSAIVVAFARSPMTVSSAAWDLQELSSGRFILGLGSQIRTHVEKRFSMPWHGPIPQMREFIAAVRAIWASWTDGTPLAFEGRYYAHTVTTPVFVPEAHGFGTPPIFLAGVGEAMTELAGEVAEGFLAHDFSTARYLKEVALPAVERGLARSGRRRDSIEVSMPSFVVTAIDEEGMEAATELVRRSISFYGSTPAYRAVLELHGWGALHRELHTLSKQGRWTEMSELIDDDVVDAFAVVGPPDRIAEGIRRRFAGLADRVRVMLPPALPDDVTAGILQELRGADAW